MKCQYRFMTPPEALQRVGTDNVALVPGNLLPFKKQYQEFASQLPNGTVLVVLPAPASKQNSIAQKVVKFLTDAGYRVTVLPMSYFPLSVR